MAEYINKQQILDKAKALQNNPFGIPLIIAEIEKADAVDLVMCKECEYRVVTDEGEYNPEDIVCSYHASDGFDETDFCSRGKRSGKDG